MSKHTPEPWASYHGTTPGLGETVIIGPSGAELQTFQPAICVVTDVESMTDEDVANARRIVACVNACQGISTDRLEKMVPGTLANLLDLKASRSQLTEARIAEIIDKRMVKACYEPMGKEIAALIVAANLLTLKGEK